MTFVISAFQMYVLHFGHFSKTGKIRVSHRVKMMTRWPGRERWPKRPINPVTQWPSSMSDELCWNGWTDRAKSAIYACDVRCVELGGRLATFESVTDTLWLGALRPHYIPARCVWVGLVRRYLDWIVPPGEWRHTHARTRRRTHTRPPTTTGL